MLIVFINIGCFRIFKICGEIWRCEEVLEPDMQRYADIVDEVDTGVITLSVDDFQNSGFAHAGVQGQLVVRQMSLVA